MVRSKTLARKKSPNPARRKGWLIVAFIVGALVVGGVLARLSPVAIVLVVLAVAALAIFVIIRPLPGLGMRTRKSGFVALGTAALLVFGGGVAGASTSTDDAPTASVAQPFAAVQTTETPRPTPTPVTTYENEEVETPIPFEKQTVDDPQLNQGTTAIVAAGAAGVMATTYRLTLVDGVEVSRETVSTVVRTEPVHEVTAIGSKAPVAAAPVPLVQQNNSGCDSNYTGACVPISSDVDCEGGSGNGPAYVRGPVQIVGSDIYDLDNDGDGIACDK